MKDKAIFFIAAATAMILSSCDLLDIGNPFGSPRTVRTGGNTRDSGSSARADTACYLAAVRFEDGYDWQKDERWGTADYDVILYKDGEAVLTVSSSSGVCSPDPDLVHIVDGHLLTERADNSSTVIALDGKEILRFEGREVLKGIVFDGDDILTLSHLRSGAGFTFRRNGTVLMEKSDAEVFGDIGDPSYGETGALYMDDGAVSFCYTAAGGKSKTYCSVRDGVETPENLTYGRTAVDMKVIGGQVILAYTQSGLYTSDDWRIFAGPDGYWFAGNTARGGERCAMVLCPYRSSDVIRICTGEAAVYFADGIAEAIDGNAGVYEDGELLWTPGGHGLLTTRACAAWKGTRLNVAASDPESDMVRLWNGSEESSLEIHGYACTLAFRVSPAS